MVFLFILILFIFMVIILLEVYYFMIIKLVMMELNFNKMKMLLGLIHLVDLNYTFTWFLYFVIKLAKLQDPFQQNLDDMDFKHMIII